MSQDSSRSSLELLFNISRDLATTLDLQTLISQVLYLSVKNVGAERGTLIVLDSWGGPVEAAIFHSDKLHSHTVDQLQKTLQHGLAGWVVKHRKPAFVQNTRKDDRWLLQPDDDINRSGAKSAMCMPLMGRDQLVGVLTIVHPVPDFFDQEQMNLLQAIADQAGMAVYNSLLYESLQSAHRRYRQLFEDSIDPIIITNLEGHILEANRRFAQFANKKANELLKLSVFELHESDPEKTRENLLNLKEDDTISYESILRVIGGPLIPIEVYIRKIELDGQRLLQWTLRDISERKLLDSLREDLSAMIYHDMRSPLSNIITSLEMLGSILPDGGDPMFHSIMAIVQRSAGRMQRLIASLLDINRLEAGQSIMGRSDTHIETVIAEAIEIVHPIFESKKQVVENNCPENIPVLQIDNEMIKRVLINLLENAAKYTPSEGKVVVRLEVEKDRVVVRVQDSGPGIPLDAQESVFDKFTRLQADRFPKGLGLGLAFCRLAVEAHGGKIWVESDGLSGSQFVFFLPV